MMVLGAAWQRGLMPLSREAIRRAIEMNGTAVKGNQRRLRDWPLGRD
jgi:indolepyruvate ferredoxin oxidoreductase